MLSPTLAPLSTSLAGSVDSVSEDSMLASIWPTVPVTRRLRIYSHPQPPIM